MRQRHQAFNISSKAKNEIFNFLNVDNMHSPNELKQSLKNYFTEKLYEEDIENDDLDNEHIFEFETPKKNKDIPQIKPFYISDKAILSGFKNNEIVKFIKNDNINEEICFSNLMKNLSDKEIENIKIDDLLNINENTLLDYENKLKELKDICNENVAFVKIIDIYLQEIQTKKNNMKYFIENIDKIDKISYDENGNLIYLK